MIHALRACRNGPRLIVFSRHADDRLWVDVLQRGGYDLIATPFDREEVRRIGYRAWLSWQKKARGLRSVWFPVTESEANGVSQAEQRRATGRSRA